MTSLALTLVLQAGMLATAQVSNTESVRPKDNMVLRWNEVTLQAIRAARTPPPMAARNLAIVHLAIYDAVNSVYRTHQHYAVDTALEAETSPEAAAASAAYYALLTLFPQQKQDFDRALADSLVAVPVGDARTEGLELGRFVADRIIELRRNDRSATAKADYVLQPGPGVWERTPPRYQDALYPDWGHVAPFCIRPGTQYKPAGPPSMRSATYAAAFREVKELGSKHHSKRTEDQTQIALFWADNAGTATPPGHWNAIAQTIARQRGLTLPENARLFALLNMSLADAGVMCWILKFTYGYWRPVTAIRRADTDDNPDTEADPDWEPLIETPPFPTYTSGHSTFSGAGASLLASFFGTDDVRFTSTSDGLPGVTRSFRGFWAAAEEAGISRIYGGIHWQFDNVDGLKTGKVLGNYVFRHYLQPRTPAVSVTRPPEIIVESQFGPDR